MKKSYKAPEILVVELDAEELCQNVVITSPTMQSLNTVVEEDNEENQFSASYRTNLWGDN